MSRVISLQPARRRAPRTARRTPSQRANFARERDLFLAFLAGKRLKLTRQRGAVINEIFGGGGHFEAEDLVEQLKRKHARVSRATVYRTLELLQECRLVEKVNFGTSRSFYEHIQPGEHHDHIICTRCNVVIEFVDERIEKLQEEICARHGIRLQSHSMRLFGECDVCRLGKDGPHPPPRVAAAPTSRVPRT